MANLYIADDGTIHSHDTRYCECAPPSTTSNPSTCAVPVVSLGRKIAFWTLTICLSLLIGYVLYYRLGIQIFERVASPSGLLEYLENFFCIIAPFAIVGGGLVCAIVYGVKCAASSGYDLSTYFLSALSAAGGSVGVGIALFLLAYVITIFLYILLGVIVIAVLVSIGSN